MAADDTGATILASQALTKNFGGVLAVNDLSLEVREGEITAIIGPNGSGKTTFFNLVMHLYDATSGQILFGGERRNLLDLPTHKINAQGLARTFQTLRLFPNLTVLENVLVAMSSHVNAGFLPALLKPKWLRRQDRGAEEAALETLSLFGARLISMCNEPASSLSYANRRRLEIARCVASRPRLILLDEPVAGMNPTETRGVIEDIQRIHEKGHTVLLIEHDMALVEGVAHRVFAFDHGTKIAEGSFREVSTHPAVIEAYLGKRAARH
ncbi:MAG: ABC transporter ATP-binding protein [Rhodospirillaceae bacterium]|nr:ABC transporter ATP-binding protein [Rhodospirillaceae bacterium]MDE0619002.1 ABC transporter ATP-binding protein [Rhodospirillaceae bacterium]MYF07294.1 ABC transporter ATP-binding protein [Rhodospirillaceae bacterium]